MSSSTILDDEIDKETKVVESIFPAPLRLIPVRTHSTISRALDAEANIPHSPSAEQVNIATDEKRDADDPGPPPNGGFHAWLQVLGSFFLFFNSW